MLELKRQSLDGQCNRDRHGRESDAFIGFGRVCKQINFVGLGAAPILRIDIIRCHRPTAG